MKLDILKLGHPLLRQRAREVSRDELDSSVCQQLIDDMIETMHAAHGAGLAAPQIGSSLRICVAEVRENPRYPSMPPLELRVWVNPTLSILSEWKNIAMYEGCLSVPGLRGRVVRPAHLRVNSMDRSGQLQVDEFDGPLAAVAQHECDHLDGKLFVDLADTRTLTFMEEYEQFVPHNARIQLV